MLVVNSVEVNEVLGKTPMLSIQTNYSSMVAQSSVNHSNSMLANAMERLSTGLRINHASDDAAGLQIADRMNSDVVGMKTAKRNVSDAISMLQTADGALDELTKITNRQRELATQAANGVNGADDKKAMQDEFTALNTEMTRILTKTQYAGQNLFDALGASDGTKKITFQIGAGSGDKLEVSLAKIDQTNIGKVDLAKDAAGSIDVIKTFAKAIDTARSTLGANVNRLEHTASNLVNVADKTKAAAGRIMDADFATESAAMTKNQLLVQAGTKVLSRANQNTGLVMGLLG